MRQFQKHLILCTEFQGSFFLSIATHLQSWIEEISSFNFCHCFYFIWSFSVLFSWVIQQPCFHDVKCCLLDARGVSFLTLRKKIIWLQSRSNFLDFRALLFLIWFKEQIHRMRIFLEHFCEVSRAVNLVTLHTKLAMRFISNLFGYYLLENLWREVLEENPGMQKHFFI